MEATKSEAEVMFMISKEFLTIKKIAIRRKCSVQAIYKILKNIKKKGLLNEANEMVEKNQSTFKPLNHQIRLHGQEFNIQILYKDNRYKQIMKKSNMINIDGNTIRLYNNSIEIYSGQSFYADDVQKSTSKSMIYWTRFINRLESEFKIILIKPRSQNIKLVNSHYSETNNEISKDCEDKGEKIRVYSNEDGKLWFMIDNSFNLHEAETLHPITSKEDMNDCVKPFFNDLRDNRPPKLSEVMGLIYKTNESLHEVAVGLKAMYEIEGITKKDIEKAKKDRQNIVPKEKASYIG